MNSSDRTDRRRARIRSVLDALVDMTSVLVPFRRRGDNALVLPRGTDSQLEDAEATASTQHS